MWPPSEIAHLYVNGSTSRVLDIDTPDLKKYPKFAKAISKAYETVSQVSLFLLLFLSLSLSLLSMGYFSWQHKILEPGEFLFIPALWFRMIFFMSTQLSLFTL